LNRVGGEKTNLIKRMLATALLCFSLLLVLLPAVLATSSEVEKYESLEETVCPINPNLSLEELLGLPGYVTVAEEPVEILGIPPGPPDGGTPMPAPVYTMIIIDDDAETYIEHAMSKFGPVDFSWNDLCNWANRILEDGDDPFESLFNINFVASQYQYWYSPSGSLADLLYEGQNAFPKPAGIDVTFILTGQAEGTIAGRSDCNDAFIVTATAAAAFCPLVNVWQHEASHLYNCPDHDPGFFTWCIMSYTWGMVTRNWCNECTLQIACNKYRFGTIYV